MSITSVNNLFGNIVSIIKMGELILCAVLAWARGTQKLSLLRKTAISLHWMRCVWKKVKNRYMV